MRHNGFGQIRSFLVVAVNLLVLMKHHWEKDKNTSSYLDEKNTYSHICVVHIQHWIRITSCDIVAVHCVCLLCQYSVFFGCWYS